MNFIVVDKYNKPLTGEFKGFEGLTEARQFLVSNDGKEKGWSVVPTDTVPAPFLSEVTPEAPAIVNDSVVVLTEVEPTPASKPVDTKKPARKKS